MKVLLVLFASAFFINVNAQKMKEYKIEIAVKAGNAGHSIPPSPG
jgi:hypothetical protein